MGCHNNITATTFPKQGPMLGREVEVCFHYDTEHPYRGIVVRDDAELPFETIIRLIDAGRYVRSTECQWLPIEPPKPRRKR